MLEFLYTVCIYTQYNNIEILRVCVCVVEVLLSLKSDYCAVFFQALCLYPSFRAPL